jgi:hypothetical protein
MPTHRQTWTAEDDRRLLELHATGRSSRSIGSRAKFEGSRCPRALRKRDRDVGVSRRMSLNEQEKLDLGSLSYRRRW